MTECNRFFLVESGNRSYLLEVEPMTTLDLAWASQKYQWPTIPLALHGDVYKKDGSVVTITDDNRESKIFVKE